MKKYSINQLLRKIKALSQIKLYVFNVIDMLYDDNNIPHLVHFNCVGDDAYKAYMYDQVEYNAHYQRRSLSLEKALESEDIFKDPKASIEERNKVFEELYSKYSSGETRISKYYKTHQPYTTTIKMQRLKFSDLWPRAEEVLKSHFDDLKPLPRNADLLTNYLEYLQKKCQAFLDKKVVISIKDKVRIKKNWKIIGDRWINMSRYFKMSRICSASNNFLQNYFFG